MTDNKYNPISNYISTNRVKIIFCFIGIICAVALDVIGPIFIMDFINNALLDIVFNQLIIYPLLYILASVFSFVIKALVFYLYSTISWEYSDIFRKKIIKHVLLVKVSFLNKFLPGEILEKIEGNADIIAKVMVENLFNIAFSLVLLLGIMISSFIINWVVGVLFLFFIVAAVIMTNWLNKRSLYYWKKTRDFKEKSFGLLERIIEVRQDLYLLNQQKFGLDLFNRRFTKLLFLERHASMRSRLVWPLIQIFLTIIMGSTIALSIYLISNKVIGIGVIVLYIQYLEKIRAPLEQISTEIDKLQKCIASSSSLKKIFHMPTEYSKINSSDLQKAKSLLSKPTDIEFKSVYLFDQSNKVILQDINFSLNAGEKLGIIGASGSGKTTIVNLLSKFLDPDSGDILINGCSIKKIHTALLRQSIAYINQKFGLLPVSIKDNLTLFQADISNQEIFNKLAAINLIDWVNNLPNGIDSIIEGNKVDLSTGQLQSLVFLRAVIKQSQIIIMDEFSSQLDSNIEEKLIKLVNKFNKNSTTITIAHKLKTLKYVDKILVLEDGKVVEFDYRNKLLNNKNTKFYSLQKLINQEKKSYEI